MKKLILINTLLLASCASDVKRSNYKAPAEFDWMPPPLQWQRNIMDCRSQFQCSAADLFNRTA